MEWGRGPIPSDRRQRSENTNLFVPWKHKTSFPVSVSWLGRPRGCWSTCARTHFRTPNAGFLLSLLDRLTSFDFLKYIYRDIDIFVKETIRRNLPPGYCLGSSGSFPLRSYLPESDLDLVVVSGAAGRGESALVLTVFNSLCLTIVENESGNNKDFAFVIRNVEFRNARTKLAHCVVNNLEVDITVNQINALESNILLEEADRFIGDDHIFKKSLLLLKVVYLSG